MIVLRTPKGWTGPKVVDGKPVEGTFRAHQVPLSEVRGQSRASPPCSNNGCRATGRTNCSMQNGAAAAGTRGARAKRRRRMGANPHANGGLLLRDLELPDFRDYAVEVPQPGAVDAEATRVTGRFLRDVMRLNAAARNFRVLGPDETASNRLDALFEVTNRVSDRAKSCRPTSTSSPDGRVMEVLSEHLCQGWLEGYLLTGRHGFFSCYEAFIHIIDSMFNQHAKWLKTTRDIPWRRPIASLNYLLTSHVWRQDHNGFSHQDPGFIDHVVNKKADVVRVYLPPDANTLLSVADHCLRSRNYVNVIVAGKQPAPQWLDMEAAIRHCTVGVGIWTWASNDAGVRAGCGDGVRRRRADAGDAGRGRSAAHASAGSEAARGQCRRSDDAAAGDRTSARPVRPGIRFHLHARQAGDLRLPRLSVADPSPDLPPLDVRPLPRARLQGGRHHDHAVRHDGAERPRPLPPGGRCDRSRASACAASPATSSSICAIGWSSTGITSRNTARTCRMCATGDGKHNYSLPGAQRRSNLYHIGWRLLRRCSPSSQ